jgi:hypothetical protein
MASSHWRADGAPKVRYRSEGEAWSAAEHRRAETGQAMTVYRCAFCTGWHMGTASGTGR